MGETLNRASSYIFNERQFCAENDFLFKNAWKCLVTQAQNGSPYGLFRSEPNPTQGYSDRELSSLIKIINSFFRQVSKQIMENPSIHLNASTNKRTATFTYNNHTHEIASPITKCFSAAYFMLSYYTWGNTTVLLNMTKPKEKYLTVVNGLSKVF